MQVYDLAWSPTGEYIIAGSTDNCARIFTASEGLFNSTPRLYQMLTLRVKASACTRLRSTTITCKVSHGTP